MALYAFAFPPFNWPDEVTTLANFHRNEATSVTEATLNFWCELAGGGEESCQHIDARNLVAESDDYQRFFGALRYEVTDTVPTAYYLMKLGLVANFICSICLLALWRATQRRSLSIVSEDGWRSSSLKCALFMPSVAYSMAQISTDFSFLLVSVLAIYIARSNRQRLCLAALSVPLSLEDKGFIILSTILLIHILSSGALRWRFANRHPKLVCLLGYLLGLGVGSACYVIINAYVPDVGLLSIQSVSTELGYTREKTYNPLISPVILFLGWVYLPSGGEFVLILLPLYMVFASVFVVGIRSMLKPKETDPMLLEARAMLFATLVVFSTLTGLTHVFESGRYYLAVLPYIIASGTYMGGSKDGRALARLAFNPLVLLGLAIVLTVPFKLYE